MCWEYYERRRREDEESRALWRDFERTTPISDPEPREATEPEVAESELEEAVTKPSTA
jgi:hypothetical protein